MNLVEIVLTVAKIAIVLGFFLNMAALSVWADRRQGAMVQDRVGPNRAVVYLPHMVARAIVLLPPALFGVLSIWLALGNVAPRIALERTTANIQIGVFVAWLSLLVLCVTVQRGGAINKLEEMFHDIDPRSIFFGGLGVHALGLVAMRFVTLEGAASAARASGIALGVVFLIVALYATSRVPEGRIAVRLAGTLHAMADTLKMIWKEDFVPKNADRLLHSLAPMIAIFPAIVVTAVIPFGSALCFADNGDKVFDFKDLPLLMNALPASGACNGWRVPLQIADLNVGILYVFAMASTGIIGAAIAGWASDNKFSLLGGLRACSQMVSYEVAMGLSLVGMFIVYGSVRMGDMAEWQGANAWGVFVQPVGFLLFLTALCAETKRVPFDQPEGESEIVAGYFLEYSGFKWGMFMVGEYLEMVFASALLVALFFGGYSLPFLHADGFFIEIGSFKLMDQPYKMTHIAVTVISMLGFFGKTILVTWVQVFFRWTLPRFRYDQLMKLGWTKLLPLAIANMMVTAVIVMAVRTAGPAAAPWLKLAADVTQGLVAILTVVGFVALIVGLLEPVERKKFLQSSAARMAAAMGGVKAEPRQA